MPEEPPRLESSIPYRWTISQLDHLLEAMAGAARALRPGSLMLPSQSLMAIMLKLTQAPSSCGISVEQPRVPTSWRPCDMERLQSLCALFDLPPRSGTIDAVEFLLSIGLHHSPLGWPSLKVLQEVRAALESQCPDGCKYPDFYITEETLASLPIFPDANGAEADLSAKFPWQTTKKPAPFDRCSEQMRWLVEVFRHFKAPIRQKQAYELEISWYEHQMRIKDEDKVCTKLLDDAISGSSTPIAQATPSAGGDAPSLTHSPAGTSEDAAPLPPPGPPPRPTTPTGLPPEPESGGISVRQLLTYLCLGSSLEDGLTRLVAMVGPSGSTATTLVPMADLHAALLQLGARVTPPSLEGDGRPRHPSLNIFCKDLGVDASNRDAVMSVKDFMTNAQAKRLCTRLDFGRRHCRAQVEKLFPKNLEPGARVLQSQRVQPS